MRAKVARELAQVSVRRASCVKCVQELRLFFAVTIDNGSWSWKRLPFERGTHLICTVRSVFRPRRIYCSSGRPICACVEALPPTVVSPCGCLAIETASPLSNSKSYRTDGWQNSALLRSPKPAFICWGCERITCARRHTQQQFRTCCGRALFDCCCAASPCISPAATACMYAYVVAVFSEDIHAVEEFQCRTWALKQRWRERGGVIHERGGFS